MYCVEKKYLLKNDIKTLISHLELSAEEIFEFYTVIKACKEVKFSKINSKYFKTIKNGAIGAIEKNRVTIKKELYAKEKKNYIGKKILKKRYKITNNSEKYSIDIYEKELKSLHILEVEFNSKEKLSKFILPEIFKDYIDKDITDDKRYQKRNLALLGDPKYNQYNIYTIFKDIENGRTLNLDKIIFSEMQTSDALRVVLYRLFIKLRLSKDTIIQSNAEDGLEEFKDVLKKSLVLLSEYNNIFDRKMVMNVISHLKVMNKSFKTYDDLHFIKNKLDDIHLLLDKNEVDNIYKTIQDKLSLEKHNIDRFFKTREFSIIFKQYELLLIENNKSFLSIQAQTSIKNSCEKTLLANYNKIIKTCEKHESCEDIESYKSLNKLLKVLKTVFQEFTTVMDKNDYKSIQKTVKQISKEIKNLKALNKQKMIIDTYIENLEVEPFNYKQLQKKVKEKNKKESNKSHKNLKKQIATLKEYNKLFK